MAPTPRRSARLARATAKEDTTQEKQPEPKRDGQSPPACSLPAPQRTPSASSSVQAQPRTPASSALVPPHEEMHPSKARPTTDKPSSALALGFSDISTNKGNLPPGLTSTPSKINGLPSSPFTFRFGQNAAQKSSHDGEVEKMMREIRKQAVAFKADLQAQAESSAAPCTVANRKIAPAKGAGAARRFSALHAAEFKKMDSIEGHASAWRAQDGRFSPVKSSLKQSPSKASLNSTLTPLPPKSRFGFAKAHLGGESAAGAPPKPSLKRTSSVANLDQHSHHPEARARAGPSSQLIDRGGQFSFGKRRKKNDEDEASAAAPPSQETDSNLPTPKANRFASIAAMPSGLARLMSPTKASSAHAVSPKKTAPIWSPSRSGLPRLAKSVAKAGLGSASRKTASKQALASAPDGAQKVKSILRTTTSGPGGGKSAIPQLACPSPQGRMPSAGNGSPVATPHRPLAKRILFSDETADGQAQPWSSPSPKRRPKSPAPRLPGQATNEHLKLPVTFRGQDGPEASLYPDLSPLKKMMEGQGGGDQLPSAEAFTFRSHVPPKLAGTAGRETGTKSRQASLHPVRNSIFATGDIPGSFPDVDEKEVGYNKENTAPTESGPLLSGTAHGMTNKKRNRADTDEDEDAVEASSQAKKKRKMEEVPEGEALLTSHRKEPGVWSREKSKAAFSRAPVRIGGRILPRRTAAKLDGEGGRKATGTKLTMSRLNMLARPKNRV